MRALPGAVVALAAGIAAAHAQSDAAAKARTVFETHCARCHQTGRLENPPAKGGLGNILDLVRLTERDDLVANVQRQGAHLERRLKERFANHHHIGDIRGRGLFWAVEYVANRSTKEPFDPALKLNARVKREAMSRGLACYAMPGTIDGRLGDHNMLAPPFIVTAEGVDRIVERFGDAVDAAVASLPGS